MRGRLIGRSAVILTALVGAASCAAGRSMPLTPVSSSPVLSASVLSSPVPSTSPAVGTLLVPNVLLEDADHDRPVTVTRGTLIGLLLSEPASGPAASSDGQVLRTIVSAPVEVTETITGDGPDGQTETRRVTVPGGTETIFRAEHSGSAVVTGPAENQSLTFDVTVTDSGLPGVVVVTRDTTPWLVQVSTGTVVEADLDPATLDIPTPADETAVHLSYQKMDGDTLQLFWRAVAPGYAQVQSHYGVACPGPGTPCATPYSLNISVVPIDRLALPLDQGASVIR